MAIGLLVAFGTQILLFLLFNKKTLSAKTSWTIAMFGFFASILLVIDVKSEVQYYLSAFFNGFNLFFFWIFYNIAHFEHTPKERIGVSSGFMFGVPSIIGIVAPLIAGFLGGINLWLAWSLSFISLGITMVLIKMQRNFTISLNITTSLKEIVSTRVLIFIAGIWDTLAMALIPIYTLYFIKTTLGYGTFLAYLSLISAIATIVIGHFSDKIKKRIIFLFPITLAASAITLAFPFATQDLRLWIILSGMISFIIPLFWNFSTAIVVDTSENLNVAIQGRDLLLALGRFLGLILVLISFLYEKTPFFIFPFLGLVILLYPLILFYRSRISKKYSYL